MHVARFASLTTLLSALLAAQAVGAQSADTTSHGDKTFLTKRDLGIAGIALGTTALLSIWDPDIAKASQDSQYQSQSTHDLALRISKVNETTLYGGKQALTWTAYVPAAISSSKRAIPKRKPGATGTVTLPDASPMRPAKGQSKAGWR